MRQLGIIGSSLLFALTNSIASGAESLFPETTPVEGVSFYKMGEHRTVYKFFFKLYDAALFTESDATPEDVLARDCAFLLEFRYLRDIHRSAILESAQHMLTKNLSIENRSRINPQVEQLHAHYRSVKAGDRSSLAYIPGRGTTFRFNGEAFITIPGAEFAQLYLQIWLGEQPISVELRDQLLAR